MSILIKNMEMPWHCGECKLKAEYDDETFCPFFADNVEYWIAAGRRHEDCPLVHLPPHGDLIDRDALMRHKGDCYDADGHLLYAVGTGNILRAPTIIPASEDGE